MRFMIKLTLITMTAGNLFAQTCCSPQTSAPQAEYTKAPSEPDANSTIPVPKSLEGILDRLKEQTEKTKTLQAKIDYLLIQEPDLLDSRTVRKGKLYFLKENKRSYLRINFDTIKQEDEKEKKQVEQIVFDGVWLIKIDYPFKKLDYYQQSTEDKPVDVFEFVSSSFPIVGFTKIQDLRKQFNIMLLDSKKTDPQDSIQLHLQVKADSKYKDDYKNIYFWIDKKTFMPARILTESTEGDIYDLKFSDFQVNKKLEKTVFKVDTPPDFSKNIHPLEQK